ncbi:hypothetical protein WOLCODRAFT_90172 [Wolfiporia cocos MD-104 SS10]|uniref:NmrA-like domain-containing protein n=1 Tax=Wolfiporia cocos (strain MD-104) TaxID=742152 RepID=A0A2H3K3Z4_WOLCO|nr:hypothetical protein WOLCODRAFT_90172 [Wolfiporia cocos MD-104 SS10]
MSTTASQYTVAIIGATGNLGKDITNVFLTSYKASFAKIVVVARDPSSPAAKQFAEQGAEVRPVNPADAVGSLTRAFASVDVVVNTVSGSSSEYSDAIFQAALNVGAKVYFPSEFGSDHRLNDFPGWDDLGWNSKREHVRKARELAKGKVKIIALYTGLFQEGTFGVSLLGFDHTSLTYTFVGSADAKTAVTAKADIGRSLAELSLLALSPESAARVPDDVRIAGQNVSYRQTKEIVERVRVELRVEPRGEITLKSLDLTEERAKLREAQLKSPAPGPLGHIKILIGEGKMDFSENHNELVNPGQKNWKWKSVEEYIREVRGAPFS